MKIYPSLLRPLLFRCPPETTHEGALAACHLLGKSSAIVSVVRKSFLFDDARLLCQVAGMAFSNPVGIPAGFDKDAHAGLMLEALGFGFVEAGSVSRDVSPGNLARPRLFRVPADEGLMVFYGVPSEGARVVAQRALVTRPGVPFGISLVEANTGSMSPIDDVVKQFTDAARLLLGRSDYFQLNLNCPNTTGGESPLDDPANLALLLQGLREVAHLPPIFLKITPYRTPAQIEAILQAIDSFAFVKAIVLNTEAPKPYVGLNTPVDKLKAMPGTLCGPVRRKPVNDAVSAWYRRIDHKRHAIVAAGGISSAADAYRTIRLGASLIGVLSALVYRGPGVVRDVKRGLCELLQRDGFARVGEAVGVDTPRA
ncbi:MAG: hypothetical protein ACKVQK_00475 [Burkholderiales bacterium]